MPHDTIPLTRSYKLCITAFLLTVRTSGQFLTDALRWVQRGKRPPACTLPVRCPTTPSSTDPDQRVRCVLFIVPRIHQRMRNVKHEIVKQASSHNDRFADQIDYQTMIVIGRTEICTPCHIFLKKNKRKEYA